MRDVRRYLELHPKVEFVMRVNSGAVQLGDPEDPRWIRFSEIDGQGRMRAAARRYAKQGNETMVRACEAQMELVSDLIGQLKDGRFLAVETKKGGWTRPGNTRERSQERFLLRVARSGGVSGFVTSLRDAERLMMRV